MLFAAVWRLGSRYSAALRFPFSRNLSSSLSRENPPPNHRLRILFCGTDDFSCPSLESLANYARQRASRIDSVDVVTRPDKLTGRGHKTLSIPKIKKVAEKLGLNVHQIDSFTGWSPPSYHDLPNTSTPFINLVIAVSFGLRVPPRILRNCTFGGLNVHPSLLPELRGAAPLQWTILQGLVETGVTLQTLHPSKFDQGAVLCQRRIQIPEPTKCTYPELRDYLSPVAADLLIEGLKLKLYVPPYVSAADEGPEAKPKSLAPKILPTHKSVDPKIHGADQILRMNRALGQLWSNAETKDGAQIRVSFGRGQDLRRSAIGDIDPGVHEWRESMPHGLPFGVVKQGQDPRISSAPLVMLCNKSYITIPTLTVAGSAPGKALAAAAKGGLLAAPQTVKGLDIHMFRGPLSTPQIVNLPQIDVPSQVNVT